MMPRDNGPKHQEKQLGTRFLLRCKRVKPLLHPAMEIWTAPENSVKSDPPGLVEGAG